MSWLAAVATGMTFATAGFLIFETRIRLAEEAELEALLSD